MSDKVGEANPIKSRLSRVSRVKTLSKAPKAARSCDGAQCLPGDSPAKESILLCLELFYFPFGAKTAKARRRPLSSALAVSAPQWRSQQTARRRYAPRYSVPSDMFRIGRPSR